MIQRSPNIDLYTVILFMGMEGSVDDIDILLRIIIPRYL